MSITRNLGGIMEKSVLQIDREIGSSLFMAKSFRFTAGLILVFAFLLLVVDHTAVSIVAAVFIASFTGLTAV